MARGRVNFTLTISSYDCTRQIMDIDPLTTDLDQIRATILALGRRYMAVRGDSGFVPGDSYIPASGKVVDGDDLTMLLDASLDMWLTAGRFADAFEKRLAQRFGSLHARMTVSGSAANLLAFASLTSHDLPHRIEPLSEIITVAAGFPTTVAPIVQNNCVPVFVDIDIRTHNVDVARLEEAISPKTRAIMLAHTLGNPFDLSAVTELARHHDLFLIEDCCDAFGSQYRGQPVGTFGDIATLSFYPAHHITTGEGGAVMTNQGALIRLVESLRDWGRDCWCAPGTENSCRKRFRWKRGDMPEGYDHKYIYSHLGYNLKATDMQAALGLSQLSKLERFIERRKANWQWLRDAFQQQGLDEHFNLPEATTGAEPSWFGFLLTVRKDSPLERKKVVEFLEAHKVGTRLLFAGNLLHQPAMSGVNHRVVGALSGTERAMRDSFWVGVWPGIDEQRRTYMIEVFKSLIAEMV